MFYFVYVILFYFFVLLSSLEAKESTNKNINVALETILEFDNQNIDSDVKIIDNVQKFLSKVRNVLDKTKQNFSKQRRSLKVDDSIKFIEFLDDCLNALNTMNDRALKTLLDIFDDEIRKYHYKGCKFYELVQNKDIRLHIAKMLHEMRHTSITNLRKRLQKIHKKIHNRQFEKRELEFITYLNSLFGPNVSESMNDVLYNFNNYRRSGARSKADLIRLVKHALRSVVFDHYSSLNKNVRKDLQTRLRTFFHNHLIGTKTIKVKDIRDNTDEQGDRDKDKYSLHLMDVIHLKDKDHFVKKDDTEHKVTTKRTKLKYMSLFTEEMPLKIVKKERMETTSKMSVQIPKRSKRLRWQRFANKINMSLIRSKKRPTTTLKTTIPDYAEDLDQSDTIVSNNRSRYLYKIVKKGRDTDIDDDTENMGLPCEKEKKERPSKDKDNDTSEVIRTDKRHKVSFEDAENIRQSKQKYDSDKQNESDSPDTKTNIKPKDNILTNSEEYELAELEKVAKYNKLSKHSKFGEQTGSHDSKQDKSKFRAIKQLFKNLKSGLHDDKNSNENSEEANSSDPPEKPYDEKKKFVRIQYPELETDNNDDKTEAKNIEKSDVNRASGEDRGGKANNKLLVPKKYLKSSARNTKHKKKQEKTIEIEKSDPFTLSQESKKTKSQNKETDNIKLHNNKNKHIRIDETKDKNKVESKKLKPELTESEETNVKQDGAKMKLLNLESIDELNEPSITDEITTNNVETSTSRTINKNKIKVKDLRQKKKQQASSSENEKQATNNDDASDGTKSIRKEKLNSDKIYGKPEDVKDSEEEKNIDVPLKEVKDSKEEEKIDVPSTEKDDDKQATKNSVEHNIVNHAEIINKFNEKDIQRKQKLMKVQKMDDNVDDYMSNISNENNNVKKSEQNEDKPLTFPGRNRLKLIKKPITITGGVQKALSIIKSEIAKIPNVKTIRVVRVDRPLKEILTEHNAVYNVHQFHPTSSSYPTTKNGRNHKRYRQYKRRKTLQNTAKNSLVSELSRLNLINHDLIGDFKRSMPTNVNSDKKELFAADFEDSEQTNRVIDITPSKVHNVLRRRRITSPTTRNGEEKDLQDQSYKTIDFSEFPIAKMTSPHDYRRQKVEPPFKEIEELEKALKICQEKNKVIEPKTTASDQMEIRKKLHFIDLPPKSKRPEIFTTKMATFSYTTFMDYPLKIFKSTTDVDDVRDTETTRNLTKKHEEIYDKSIMRPRASDNDDKNQTFNNNTGSENDESKFITSKEISNTPVTTISEEPFSANAFISENGSALRTKSLPPPNYDQIDNYGVLVSPTTPETNNNNVTDVFKNFDEDNDNEDEYEEKSFFRSEVNKSVSLKGKIKKNKTDLTATNMILKTTTTAFTSTAETEEGSTTQQREESTNHSTTKTEVTTEASTKVRETSESPKSTTESNNQETTILITKSDETDFEKEQEDPNKHENANKHEDNASSNATNIPTIIDFLGKNNTMESLIGKTIYSTKTYSTGKIDKAKHLHHNKHKKHHKKSPNRLESDTENQKSVLLSNRKLINMNQTTEA